MEIEKKSNFFATEFPDPDEDELNEPAEEAPGLGDDIIPFEDPFESPPAIEPPIPGEGP